MLATSAPARDAQLCAFNPKRIAIENQLRAWSRAAAPLRPCGSPPAAPISFDLPISPVEYRPTGAVQLDAQHAERANIPNQLQVARRMQHGLLERLQGQPNVFNARAALPAPRPGSCAGANRPAGTTATPSSHLAVAMQASLP